MKKLFRNLKNFIKFHNSKVYVASNVATDNTVFLGRNKVGENSVLINSQIGDGTYFGKNTFMCDIKIGKFCSVGNNVKVISATHPTDTFVSTHPAFFSLNKQAGFTYAKEQKFLEKKYFDKNNKISVEIGNDVWIGDDVTIMGGVKIGNGAVIATRALVTKDVLPYSISGGVPAKVIKNRFSDLDIEFLENLKWWDKGEEWLNDHIDFFDNINNLKEKLK